jgi:hypothetical protein
MTIDREKYVNQDIIKAYEEVFLKIPAVSSRGHVMTYEHVSWAKDISILLKQLATSAKFKNRG